MYRVVNEITFRRSLVDAVEKIPCLWNALFFVEKQWHMRLILLQAVK
jgi:hypothetical protein